MDTSVVIKHEERSKGELKSSRRDGPQLRYVDSHKDDLLLPDRDRLRPETIAYAKANLRPFETVLGYELHEEALEELRKQLVENPLSDESVNWIDRKFKWFDPEDAGGTEGAKRGAILDKMRMPRKIDVDGGKLQRTSVEAIARHGMTEGGKGDLRRLLVSLNSEASQDLQILAIAMKESEERLTILLTNDYDLFAFPIWHDDIDKSECSSITMVLGPRDVRWVVSMRDGSARVLDDKTRASELYSIEDFREIRRALQHSKAKG